MRFKKRENQKKMRRRDYS